MLACATLPDTRTRVQSCVQSEDCAPPARDRRAMRKSATEAERAGFEPATHLSARTRFPVALLRPLGHLSVLRSGEGGIRTLDGGIHPHNALAGRRLQPLGHFSALSAQDSRRGLRRITPSGGGNRRARSENTCAGSPLIPPGIETRLRLSEAGFPLFGSGSSLGSRAWPLAL
jgi:hypothetical protein